MAVLDALLKGASKLGQAAERLAPSTQRLVPISELIPASRTFLPPIVTGDAGKHSLKKLTDAFNSSLSTHLSLPPEQQAKNSADAAERVAQYMGKDGKAPKALLNQNQKLMKANMGYNLDMENPLVLSDGKGVETTGLALSPAMKIGDKFNTCPNSQSCKESCLGLTAGNYFQLGGGNDLDAVLGPRLSSYNRTRALFNDPEAFAVHLHNEIGQAKQAAEENGNHLGVRLNVLSDIHPKVYKALMDANPDVGFYDYTKNIYAKPVADNHHLTYSSTGISQPASLTGLANDVANPHQNWTQIRNILERGDNAAMSFSNKLHMPESVFDEETGKTFKVINGDLHDFRPIDEKGVIVGLKNKAANTTHDNAVETSGGFLVHYDPQIPTDEKGRQLRGPSPGLNDKGNPIKGAPVIGNTQVTIPIQEKKNVFGTNDNTQVDLGDTGTGDTQGYASGGVVRNEQHYSLPSQKEAGDIEDFIRGAHFAGGGDVDARIAAIREQALSEDGISDEQMAQIQDAKPKTKLTPDQFGHALRALVKMRGQSPQPASESMLRRQPDPSPDLTASQADSPSMTASAPSQAPIPLEAGFGAPAGAIKPLLRGALTSPVAALEGIMAPGKLAYQGARELMGNAGKPPELFPMTSAVSDWLASKGLGSKDPSIDAVGEGVGMMSPRAVVAPLQALASRGAQAYHSAMAPVIRPEEAAMLRNIMGDGPRLVSPAPQGGLSMAKQAQLAAPPPEPRGKVYPAGMNPTAMQQIRGQLNSAMNRSSPRSYTDQMKDIAAVIRSMDTPTLNSIKPRPQITSMSPYGDIFNEGNIPQHPMRRGGAA